MVMDGDWQGYARHAEAHVQGCAVWKDILRLSGVWRVEGEGWMDACMHGEEIMAFAAFAAFACGWAWLGVSISQYHNST